MVMIYTCRVSKFNRNTVDRRRSSCGYEVDRAN